MSIQIKDTGVGIPNEDIDKLFKLFGKAKDVNKLNKKGTGLGLTICKKIVESMGGKISIESVYGKGTTFKMQVKVGLDFNSKSRSNDSLLEVNPSYNN